MTKRIKIAGTDEEIKSCFPVMAELRPHITGESEFRARVRKQQSINGYTLAFLTDGTEVKAAAGFYISECLAWGKVICVEELVTTSSERSKGYGQSLFDWIIEYARENGVLNSIWTPGCIASMRTASTCGTGWRSGVIISD